MPHSEWDYVIAAYVITYVVLIGYAVHVVRRLRAAQRERDEIQHRLEVES
jgi:heme exporter protein CcmD